MDECASPECWKDALLQNESVKNLSRGNARKEDAMELQNFGAFRVDADDDIPGGIRRIGNRLAVGKPKKNGAWIAAEDAISEACRD